MHQSGTGHFWRKLAACLASYVIALQAAVSGLALATLATSSNAPTAPICSAHAADPADAPSQPTSDSGLCPCAPGCIASCSALSDAPAIATFAPGAALTASLSRCRSAAVTKLTVRGPQIPRAPPTV